MSLEAYIPSSLSFDGAEIAEPIVLTLYEPDSETPAGSLTAAAAPETGQRGTLRATATRAGQTWHVELPDIEITRRTAVGAEFRIHGKPQRRPAN